MQTIYEPKGKAREYSPLSLNLYSGCDHGCKYCYVPSIFSMRKDYNHADVKQRPSSIEALEKEAKKFAGCKQVLLSFTTDPYTQSDFVPALTRKALEILHKNKIPVAILTKGGTRCLRDLDLFKAFGRHIKVGASLVFNNDEDTKSIEPGAADYSDRLTALGRLHDAGIRTWVSLEPVMDPEQTISIIRRSFPFVDEYKVGKLNHDRAKEDTIDWHSFLVQAVTLLRELGMQFYVKKDLAAFAYGFKLTKQETDMDRLLVPQFETNPNDKNSQADFF